MRILGLLIKKDLITVLRSLRSFVCQLIFMFLCILAIGILIYFYSFVDTAMPFSYEELSSYIGRSNLCDTLGNITVADGIEKKDEIIVHMGGIFNSQEYVPPVRNTDNQVDVIFKRFDPKNGILDYDLVVPEFYKLYPFFEKRGFFGLFKRGYSEITCVQDRISRTFLQMAVDNNYVFDPRTLAMPSTKHNIYLDFPYFASVYYGLTVLLFASFIVKEICEEKENGIHAYLILMGTPRSVYLLAHFISAFIKLWVFSLPVGLMFLAFHKGFALFVANFMLAHIIMSLFMLLTTLIKSHGKIAFLGAAVTVVGWIPCFFALPKEYSQTTLVYIVSFLVPQTAVKYVHHQVQMAASYDAPFQWFTDHRYAAPLTFMFMYLLFQLAFLILLTFYLDMVVPIDSTIKKHPLFIFGYNPESKTDESAETNDGHEQGKNANAEYFEPVKSDGVVGIEATDVVKRFGNETAVNHVTFKAYEGEVTALLGHNGAGKSTLFGCLTGFITPTCGSITTKDNKSCGYTPQWDPLFPFLNVEEHLEFYGKLKSGSVHKDEVARVIKEVGLVGAEKTQGRNLSGGMKRKLSVGMALIGGSEIVLLDEPTAGMDPMARRVVIDIVNGLKTGRTVLITTHYMDEAELLSDRIIIMCKGELSCNGSADFLKTKLGTGFMLTTVFNVSQRQGLEFDGMANAVLDIVKKHCDGAKIDGPVGNQFTILLPNGSQNLFAGMFEELENKKDELKIDSFGVAANGLEQVFIKITDVSDPEEGETAKKLTADFLEVSSNVQRSLSKQLTALVIRKLRYESRNLSHCCIPLCAFILAIVLMSTLNIRADKNAQISPDDGHPAELTLLETNLTKAPKMTVAFLANKSLDKTDTDLFYSMLQKELAPYPQIIPVRMAELSELTQLMRDVPTLGFGIHLFPFWKHALGEAGNNVTVFQILVRNNYPTGCFAAYNLLTRLILKGMSKDVQLTANVYTVDKSHIHENRTSRAREGTADGASIGLVLLFPLIYPIAFSMAVYLCNVEKNNWSIHMYRLTGTNRIVYWMSMYLIDMVFGLFLGLILLSGTAGVISRHNDWRRYYQYDRYVTYSYLMTVPAAFTLTSQAYLLGRYIKSAPIAMIVLFFLNTLVTGSVYMASTIQTRSVKMFALVYPGTLVFPMLPFYDLILSNMLSQPQRFPALMFVSIASCGFYIFLMSLEGILYKCKCRQSKAEYSPDTHPDVIKEIEKADSCNPSDFAVVATRLKRKFKKQVAVECLSLAIPAKECFGLLGANGAGKSTSFSMLTGTLKPTSGSATVDGFNVEDQPRFGFCPQADAVLMTLTVSENLYLYARLSGRSNGDQCVEILLNLLKLKHRAHNIVKKCSGGEKRRLSVGVSILTNSQVVMLDEPTAGIDPRTRRHVWDLLMAMRATGTSIILSSHSMEECETLCTRIAFLDKGKMKGIGTSQHLKSVFGNSYTLKLTIGIQPVETFDKINTEVQTLMGCPSTKSIRGSSVLVFSVPKAAEKTWSSLYKQVVEYVSQHEEIKEFILVETSLEEAFIATAATDEPVIPSVVPVIAVSGVVDGTTTKSVDKTTETEKPPDQKTTNE